MDIKKLITAFSNKEVIDEFTAALQPAILSAISELKVSVDDLRKEISAKDIIIYTLKKENSNLQSSLADCQGRLDQLETYTRVDNLIFKGLPELHSEVAATSASIDNMIERPRQQLSGSTAESSGSTMSVVLDFVGKNLGVNLQASDISIAHRLPKGKSDRIRPVMVRFTNRRTVLEI